MAGFVGLNIHLTLRDPPNASAVGLVAGIHPETSTLVLHDVFFPLTGHRLPQWSVAGHQIADIKVIERKALDLQREEEYGSHSGSNSAQRGYVDPAILSVGRRPEQVGGAAGDNLVLERVSVQRPGNGVVHPGQEKDRQYVNTQDGGLPSAFPGLNISGTTANDDTTPARGFEGTPMAVRRASVDKTRTGKPMDEMIGSQPLLKVKRKVKKQGDTDSLIKGTRVKAPPPADADMYKGQGWRQTPILQSTIEDSPKRSKGGKQANRQRRAMDREAANNGWATEDATDIQDLPEFDFIGELSKFDKKNLFDQMRMEDLISEDDRLAGHNKIKHRPGTYGGKNLHPTEMVLSPKMKALSRRGSQLSSGDETDELRVGGGMTARRTTSKTSLRHEALANSGVLGPRHSLGESRIDSRTNLLLNGTPSPQYNMSDSSRHGTFRGRRTPLVSPPTKSYYVDDPMRKVLPPLRVMRTNAVCPVLSCAERSRIRSFCEEKIGITAASINELVGQGVTRSILSIHKESQGRISPDLTVFVLAGCHKRGKQALCVARHLHDRGAKVIVCFNKSSNSEPSIAEHPKSRTEVERYANELRIGLGIPVMDWSDESLVAILSEFEDPPNQKPTTKSNFMILDGITDDSLPPQSQPHRPEIIALHAEIIDWINQMRLSSSQVISIQTPSQSTAPDDFPMENPSYLGDGILSILPSHVICLGAVDDVLVQGYLVRAPETKVLVIDVGLNAAWEMAGVRDAHLARSMWGDEWVVEVAMV